MSAADMIKRFRESKPTAPSQREKVALWWDKPDRDDLEESEEVPRSRPKPTLQSNKPSKLLSNFRQPRDLDHSFDIDNIIESELNVLSKELRERDTYRPNKSYDPRVSMSLNNSFELPYNRESPTFRFGGKPRNSDINPVRLSESRDFLNSSFDTLGSTGFRGLLVSDLKLDGAKPNPEQAPVKSNEEDMKALNASLEGLMKSLAENQQTKDHNPFFPDGVEHSIPQVTTILDSHMQGFRALFGGKHLEEDQQEKALIKRDQEMKEQGRREEREKRLLEWDHAPLAHQLEPGLSTFGQVLSDMGHLAHPLALPTGFARDGATNAAHRSTDQQSNSTLVGNFSTAALQNPMGLGPLAPLAPLSTLQTQQGSTSVAAPPGSNDSPFPLLEKGSAGQREAFAVGNSKDSAADQHSTELSPSDTLAVQQMRELSSRLSEKAEMLRAMTADLSVPQRLPEVAGGVSAGTNPQNQPHHSHSDHPHAHRSNEHMRRYHNQPYPVHSRHPHSQQHFMHRGHQQQPHHDPLQRNSDREYEGNGVAAAHLDFEPRPELEHKSVYSAARAIDSALNVAMDCLKKRLPPDFSSLSLAERVKLTLQKEREASSAAAKAGDSSSASAKPNVPSAVSRPSSPMKEPANNKDMASQMAASVVASVLESATAPPPTTPAIATSSDSVTRSAATTPVPEPSRPVASKSALWVKAEPSSTAKSASQQLDDLDAVLGADSFRAVKFGAEASSGKKKPAATLGLGQFVPADSSIMQQQKYLANSPPADLQHQTSQHSSQGPPLPWEAGDSSLGYLRPSVDHRNLRGIMSPAVPVSSHHPPHLTHQQPNPPIDLFAPSAPPSYSDPAHNFKYGNSFAAAPVDSAYRTREFGTSSAFSSPAGAQFTTFTTPALPPVQGSATMHLRQQLSRSQEPPPAYSPQQNKQQPPYASSGAQLQLQSPVSVAAPQHWTGSPSLASDASTREKEAYLLQMRQLRQQHLSTQY